MASLVLEGATLGKRHQHYNKLLRDATSADMVQPTKIDYAKTDVENLLNIDIANNNKDVEYILDVLKGEDMLYVSRAMKLSNWLINDDQFADIIEPEYLHSELFPQMMAKARSKFLLHIRLTLKNETRVNKFFQYFRDKNLPTALKWLPKCSLNVIEDAVEKHAREIPTKIFKRLCERSSTVLGILARTNHDCTKDEFKAAMILLRSDTEIYTDALSHIDQYYLPKFGKKQTKVVMENSPHWFINNFEIVMSYIHLDTFAKYLEEEEIEIKTYVLKQLETNKVKLFLSQEKLNNFIKYMPKEDKYEFVKQCVERTSEFRGDTNKCAMIVGGGSVNNSTTYLWYKHAPFIVAFGVLRKMIRRESNPEERNAMLMLLVNTARRNLAHIRTLLQYYRKRHINEPFRFKIQFVNLLLQTTDPHLYNGQTWSILEEIFCSMKVYKESENNVQTCIRAIIVHKVIRNQVVPDIIENKFNFDSLKSCQEKLIEPYKEKVFKYLYKIFINKLNNENISNHTGFGNYVELFTQGLKLLKDWKKNLIDYPVLITKIKDCIKLKNEKGWSTSLAPLYNANKSWKKNLFEVSLTLDPSPIVYMNALKHDPELVVRHMDEVEMLDCNDFVCMEQFFWKLRVYWPQTMASEWLSAYREQLNKPSGHKAVIRGLCSLLNQQQLIDFLKNYEPCETKINWADTDDHELSLCKNLAKCMHIARPQTTLETVLSYAKGDYVQFTQPSLSAVLYNIRPKDSREGAFKLLNGITTLQKHGIHLAFSKLTTTDLKEIFLDVWKSNKNLSVRAAVFEKTHELLCREHDEVLLAELWQLMLMILDSLTEDENKAIYNTIGNVANVHPSIKPAYCEKGYTFLKSLPPKVDCNIVIKKIKVEIMNTVEIQSSNFIETIILEFVDEVLLKKSYTGAHWLDMQLLVSYLLGADDECTQLERYQKVFVPLMEKSILSWNKTYKNCSFIRRNFGNVMKRLHRNVVHFALKKNKAKPSSLYNNILTKLEGTLPATRNYVLFRQLKLAIAFIEILDKYKLDPDTVQNLNSDSETQNVYLKTISDLGIVVTLYLKEDIDVYSPSIYRVFGKALNKLWGSFSVYRYVRIKYLKNFLTDQDSVPIYLLVINLMCTDYYSNDEKEDMKQVHEMLKSHPSLEVQVHYFNKFGHDPILDE